MIRVFEAFAGYGSQAMALKRAGIPHQLVGISEIDRYAIQAYNAVHGETVNYGDISKIDWMKVPDFDLFTYSFPCQDISNAGFQRGFTEGSGTRSGLLWECRKAIEAKKPKYLLMENVKALVSKKFMPEFLKWEAWLRVQGYSNFWKVLNAKDYGVPQNRERVFMVSILGDAHYEFPEKITLEKRLKDVLEEKVDEKYYLSEKALEKMTLAYSMSQTGIVYVGDTNKGGQKGVIMSADGICSALTATDYKQPKQILCEACDVELMDKVIQVGRVNSSQDGVVVSSEGIAPCHTSGHGNTPKIIEPLTCAMRGRNPDNPSDRTSGIPTEQRIEIGGNISNCITTVQKDSMVIEPQVLTPKRTEYGKAIRKDYETGKIEESRHNMTELQPREDGISNTITTVQKDNLLLEPTLRIPQATKQGYAEVKPGSVFDASYPESKTRRGRVQNGGSVCPALTAHGEPPCYYEGIDAKQLIDYINQNAKHQQDLIQHENDICRCIPAGTHGSTPHLLKTLVNYNYGFRIRKLTPRECFRLMGVSETDIDSIQNAGISNSQQYKMAGNSIVVDVLEDIFRQMFNDHAEKKEDIGNMKDINYRWTLKDARFAKDKGKVFSCFACGGGSTMGYKLAGFDVIGCNEIDTRIFDVYVANHHPRFAYNEDIREFVERKDLPEELYHLDVLDGSPPCSSFSMAGNRDKDWGKEKKFKEGQKLQVLDTLFFDFIKLAKRLQPKVVVAENVKGLLLGEAYQYVRRIYREFDEAGYYCQHYLLDASRMGVPQQRERVFFICLRKDLAGPFLVQKNLFEQIPYIDMEFNERPVLYGEFADYKGKEISEGKIRYYWDNRIETDNDCSDVTMRLDGKQRCFNNKFIKEDKVPYTLPAGNVLITYAQPRYLSEGEVCCISSFPQDYEFLKQSPHYICGMSVPPLMMYRIAQRIYESWLKKI